jgi:hypothetical protein
MRTVFVAWWNMFDLDFYNDWQCVVRLSHPHSLKTFKNSFLYNKLLVGVFGLFAIF